MGRLVAFNFMTLNGYKGLKRDISWHKHDDKERHEYALEGISLGNKLVSGRIKYEMMAAYCATENAIRNDYKIGEGMNNADRIVFSISSTRTFILRKG